MRIHSLLALFLISLLPCLGQTADNSKPSLPKDPQEVFAAAAPFYDFSDPKLKPWHLKATYQLYDEKGNPGEKGTFEYWWASPQAYRSTWIRPSATHTDWHTADGKRVHQYSGERLKFLEYKIETEILSPLPRPGDTDSANGRLATKPIGSKSEWNNCIMALPRMPKPDDLRDVPLGLFPTYCFDAQLPVLRAIRSFGGLSTEFNHIVKVQDKYLAREILVFEAGRKVLSAQVDSITGLAPSDPALTPIVDESNNKLGRVSISAGVAVGMLNKKAQPVYPLDAKEQHISGAVVLQGIIDREGKLHDLHVISAPMTSLAISALYAVSKWEYKPYLLMGEPVEVQTTINVIFTLGN
jgi:TonB family protein